MDKALILKIKFENGSELTDETIHSLLSSSELIKALTSEFSKKSLYPIWRFLALSEIPFAENLKYTQDLMGYIEKTYVTQDGFSITGETKDILPCYNAMLAEAYSKLGYTNTPYVRNAIEWIKNYQVFERNKKTEWLGTGIKKYGGCMNCTPCYIGIAKSVKALIYYSLNTEVSDNEVTALIQRGTDYLMHHNLFQRISVNEPITKHILDIAYPQSYQLNIVELLDIIYMTKNMNHPSVGKAIDYIKNKKIKDDYWKINYIYKADGYVSFDKRGGKGEWVTYLLEKYLSSMTKHENI